MAARAQTAPLLFHRKGVGQHLRRMVVERQGVDDGNIAIIGDFVQELLAQLSSDDQQIVHAGQHADRVLHALIVAHMGVGEVREAHAQIVARRLEGASRAGGTPHEVRDDVLAAEMTLVDARLLLGLQLP